MRRFLLAAGLAALPLLGAAAPHGLTAADLVSLARVSEPALSPGGRQLVFTLRETDIANDRGRTDLWLLELDGDAPARRLTSHEENDGAADWAGSDRGVYFLSSRSGTAQVWYLPLGGGEATQVTRLPLEVTSFRASPLGNRLVVAVEVFPDCSDLPCTAKRLEEAKAAQQRGQAHDRLFVRHWDRWMDGRVSQLFSIALDAGPRARGEPVPLTARVDADVPTMPLGGREDFAFSPDGAQVVFAARVRGRIEPISTNFDIWRVAADGSAQPANLTADNPAWDAQPAFSPDGRLLAHLAMERPGFEADRFRLVVRDAQSGKIRFTTRDWDRSIGGFRFSADSREIYAVADDLGQHPLFAIDLGNGERRKLTTSGNVTGFDVAGERIVFGMQSLSAPADFYLIDGRAPALQVTHVNAARLAEVRFGEYEPFSFAGAAGDTVYGYVMKPWNFTAGQRYPIAFIVHGGPQSSFANTWSYRWNPQVFASAGYVVFMPNPRGSTGFGQEFEDDIIGDWGGRAYEDILKGTDWAEALPYVAKGRISAAGASYGGYMVNWMQGHTNRFKAMVSHDGIFNLASAQGATEELWFPNHEFGEGGVTNPETRAMLDRWSPHNFADKWQTPMLVVHSQQDFRLDVTEGYQAFTALKVKGVPAKFLYFPDEGHWVLKPRNRRVWWGTVLDWMDQYLRPETRNNTP